MISAEKLYQKIIRDYPDLELDTEHDRSFHWSPRPPLTQEELELLESGFDVKPMGVEYEEEFNLDFLL